MKRVVVLGGSGMLGSMLADVLSRDDRLRVSATVRSAPLAAACRRKLPAVEWRVFAMGAADADEWQALDGADWAINAIGLIKQVIRDDDPGDVARAIAVNAVFPHLLGAWAQRAGARVLQIATDCVYSGRQGGYVERDAHDALDMYGKTKSLGEARYPALHHLRCSIVGPAPRGHRSLLTWFLGQPPRASVQGFTNHRWNGVTTLHFARVCRGVIVRDLALPHLQHLVPAGVVSKEELLRRFARAYGREDVAIHPAAAPEAIDRSLATEDGALNHALWAAAGYDAPPTVPRMIDELAAYDRRLAGLDVPEAGWPGSGAGQEVGEVAR